MTIFQDSAFFERTLRGRFREKNMLFLFFSWKLSSFFSSFTRSRMPSLLKSPHHRRPSTQLCQSKNLEAKSSEHRPLQIDVSKPISVPIRQHIPRKREVLCVDDDNADAAKRIAKQEEHEEKIMKSNINYDAVYKWCSELPQTHQTRIARIALNSTKALRQPFVSLWQRTECSLKLHGLGTWSLLTSDMLPYLRLAKVGTLMLQNSGTIPSLLLNGLLQRRPQCTWAACRAPRSQRP